jgi:predicted dehydrogenase
MPVPLSDPIPIEPVSAAPVRLAVVGCGGSRQTYGAILPLLDAVEVGVLMDLDPVSARLWSRESRGASVVTDFAEVLADPTIEAALLTSPVEDRARQAIALAEAGKHAYCASPLPARLSVCDDLARRSAECGTVLMVGLARRFDRSFLGAKQAVEEGRIGRIHQIRCDWSFYAGWAARRASLRTWRGVFEFHASQTVDFCRWVLGEIQTVSADIDLPGGGGRVACQGNVILQHERGLSIHHISRTDHKDPVEQYLLSGDEGTLELSFSGGWSYDSTAYFRALLHRIGRAPEDVTPVAKLRATDEAKAHNPYLLALRHFALCVRLGVEPQVGAADGRAVTEAILAAYLSSMEQIKVALPLTGSGHIEESLRSLGDGSEA